MIADARTERGNISTKANRPFADRARAVCGVRYGCDGVAATVAVVVGTVGIVTIWAAVGVARAAHLARPVAWATRVADLVIAAPGLAVIVLLVRTRQTLVAA